MRKLFIILLFFFCSQCYGQFSASLANYTSQNAIKFGVLTNSDVLNNTEKAHVGKDTLGCNWARTAIVTSQWDGTSGRYETYDGLDIKQAVNFSYYPNSSGQNFPTGTILTNFIDTVELILDKYPNVGVFVYLNEELNQTYHSGYVTEYYEGLVSIYPVVHARGIPVTNGGLAGAGLDISVYRWLVGKYGQSAADQYGQGCMTNAQINAAQTPDSNPTLETAAKQIDTAIMYKDYMDFYNIHLYEVLSRTNTQPDTVTQITPNVLRYQKEYLEEQTGKPVINNETGQRDNNQPDLVTNMLAEYYRLGMFYVLWFNGDDGSAGARGLTDPATGDIYPNGEAFYNYVTTHQ